MRMTLPHNIITDKNIVRHIKRSMAEVMSEYLAKEIVYYGISYYLRIY